MGLIEAHLEQYIDDVRAIFLEYAEWLGFDLCFQGFDQELAELPGGYSPPAGRLFLAVIEDRIAGCVALRKLDPDVCEMKRLYVRPAFRGQGLGKVLAKAVIDEARKIGYERMRLDTLPSMTAAVGLYQALGFADVEPYRYNPIEGARYMELMLSDERMKDKCEE